MVKKKFFCLVSVVMPVYNDEKFVGEAIESILNQSYKNFELIIVDDVSTDKTPMILKEYAKKDNRIKIIRNKINSKVAISRNNGIKQSKGKYIAVMDSDDISLPNRLEKQVDFLEKNKDIFLVGGGRIFINEKGFFNGVRFGVTGKNRIEKILRKSVCIVHPSVMFRNSKNFFYREKFFTAEDYDFYLRLISSGKKLNNLFFPLIKYRFKNSSISRSKAYLQELFTKKTQSFFIEREKKGKDSYDKFNVEELKKQGLNSKINYFEEIKTNFTASNYTQTEKLASEYLKKKINLEIFLYYVLSKYVFLALVSKQIVHFLKLINWYVFY